MNEIKPKMVKGEPYCHPDCPQYRAYSKGHYCDIATLSTNPFYCVPGVQEQRDQALAREKELQREICDELAPTADQYPHEMAKDRDWKCYDTE